MQAPSRLYKYKAFNADTLTLLGNRQLYYSRPSAFNDPLDCEPVLIIDAELTRMETLIAHIHGWEAGSAETVGRFAEWKAWAGQDAEVARPYPALSDRNYREFLAGHITAWLRAKFDGQGILCLASNWNSPLMWSHYADSHRGLCIEFDNDDGACSDLREVRYDRPRGISLSDVADWQLYGNQAAEERVRSALLSLKSPAWDYEKEWRDIVDAPGLRTSPFEISAVYFGMRCPLDVKTAVVSLVHAGLPKVAFYEVAPPLGSFQLERSELNPNEQMLYVPTESARRVFAPYAERVKD